jgi:serine/threonine protein kinase
VVKRSIHKASGHTVALKTYDKKTLNNEVATTNLHREISVLATLKHPNVMTLYEVIDSRTHVHLVMELCQGTNLFHTIKKRKPDQRLPEPEAAQIFRQIVSAVDFMHNFNVVHRDLKLDNILTNVDSEGNHVIKLIDFGFATGCQQDEKLTNVCGTPHYMDPDLVRK